MKQMLGTEKRLMCALLTLMLLIPAAAQAAPQQPAEAPEGGADPSWIRRQNDGIVTATPPCESADLIQVRLGLTDRSLLFAPHRCICSTKGKDDLVRVMKEIAASGEQAPQGLGTAFENMEPGQVAKKTLYCYPLDLVDAFREPPESSEGSIDSVWEFFGGSPPDGEQGS